jgi:hypothetical protein
MFNYLSVGFEPVLAGIITAGYIFYIKRRLGYQYEFEFFGCQSSYQNAFGNKI